MPVEHVIHLTTYMIKLLKYFSKLKTIPRQLWCIVTIKNISHIIV